MMLFTCCQLFIIYLAVIFQFCFTTLCVSLTTKASVARVLTIILLCLLSFFYIIWFEAISDTIFLKCINCNVIGAVVICARSLLCYDIGPETTELLSKEEKTKERPGNSETSKMSLLLRLKKSLKLVCDVRGVYTKRHSPSSEEPTGINRIPLTGHKADRERFFLSQATYLLLECLIPDVLWLILRTSFQPGTPRWKKHFGTNTEFLLTTTLSHILARFVASLSFWIAVYCVLDIAYRLTAVLCVAVGLTEPQDWPPLFGSISCLYSIRNFWGKFWHQLLRPTFISFSNVLTIRVISKLPNRCRHRARIISTFSIFALSGMIHILADLYYQYYGLADTFRVVWFFMACSLGIMLESCAAHGYHSIAQTLGRLYKRRRKPSMILYCSTNVWRRTAGYIWVLMWFSFFTPMFLYPAFRALEYERPGRLIQ